MTSREHARRLMLILLSSDGASRADAPGDARTARPEGDEDDEREDCAEDDRFHTLPYRWGYINGVGPKGGWWIIDHREKKTQLVSVPDYSLSEMTFVTRKKGAEEGDGYLIGIGFRPEHAPAFARRTSD